jgi:hypothetical protein
MANVVCVRTRNAIHLFVAGQEVAETPLIARQSKPDGLPPALLVTWF